MPRDQGLDAPGCVACLGACAGPRLAFCVGVLLLTEWRDISTTAAVTPTSTTPMMTKGSGLFDFAGASLGLRLIRLATVREMFYGASRGRLRDSDMVTSAPPPVETGGAA